MTTYSWMNHCQRKQSCVQGKVTHSLPKHQTQSSPNNFSREMRAKNAVIFQTKYANLPLWCKIKKYWPVLIRSYRTYLKMCNIKSDQKKVLYWKGEKVNLMQECPIKFPARFPVQLKKRLGGKLPKRSAKKNIYRKSGGKDMLRSRTSQCNTRNLNRIFQKSKTFN